MNEFFTNGGRRLALSAIAVLIMLLMLPNLVWLAWAHDFRAWIEALILPAALLFGLFVLLGRMPWLACLLLAPFALLAPLETFYVATYQSPSNAATLATLYSTNSSEARTYLGYLLSYAIGAPLLGLATALLASWQCRRVQLKWVG